MYLVIIPVIYLLHKILTKIGTVKDSRNEFIPNTLDKNNPVEFEVQQVLKELTIR